MSRNRIGNRYSSASANIHAAEELVAHQFPWCVPPADSLKIGDDYYVVMKEHGSFSLIEMHLAGSVLISWTTIHAELYMPIHSSMTKEDIEGAVHAWFEDGGWKFSHATPAEHHEFAELCEARALAAVQPVLNDRIERYMVATTDGPIQVAARSEFQAWRAFAEKTQEAVRKYALAEPLGHWERNRDLHHARTIIGRAMAEVLNTWGAAPADASEHNYYQKVNKEASKMALALQQAPSETIKPWPTHRAEVAAAEAAKKAKEAKEAEAETATEE